MKRLHAHVSGRVQGVGYRAAVRKRVVLVDGVTGFIRNLPDGRVEIVAEGTEAQLKEVLSLAEEGSFWSSVDSISISYSEYTGEFREFSVTY